MNRHHPYGENPMRHAGASPPSGFGPDRSHRGGYRGGGRGGRGRGAGHNSFQSGKMNGNFNAYDQPPPDMGYGGYGNMQPQAPPQDPYYQNYGPGTSAPYPPMNSSGYAAAPGYNNNKYEGTLTSKIQSLSRPVALSLGGCLHYPSVYIRRVNGNHDLVSFVRAIASLWR